MNKKDEKDKETKNEEMTFEEVLQQQEELGNVDTSIAETIEAMNIGRENVAQRFYRQEGNRQSEESTHPLDMMREGRKRILDKITSTNKWQVSKATESEVNEFDSIRSLNQQLFERLEDLTRVIPEDTNQKNLLEGEIQAAIKGYLLALHKILNPLRFNREGIQLRNKF